MNTYIDEFEIDQIKKKFKEDGTEKLHVICDFDRTLTYSFSYGKKTPSIIAILRDKKYLAPGYAEKAQALFDKYHPIEIDQNIPLEEKKEEMADWWNEHNKLLIESGLSRNDIEKVVETENINLRKGVREFLDLLLKNNIPLIIFSVSGIGDAIPLYIEKEYESYDNIYYITNTFNWDKEGKATSANEPIIHSFNKDESALPKEHDAYEIVKERRNIIVIGDSLGDITMAQGFNHNNIIKIGFLNENIEESRKAYREAFNAVIEGDGNFNYPIQLIEELLE
jgi:5'-nucleotidase